jgi:hypothetical protein
MIGMFLMALAATQKVIMRLVDIQGKTGTTSFRITTAGSVNPATAGAAYTTSLLGISDCGLAGVVGQTSDNTPEGTLTTNDYNCADKLAVEYVGSQNDHHILHFPDPLPTNFTAGSSYKDGDPAALASFKTAIEANVVDKLGNPVTVVRMYRQMSRRLKPNSRKFI